jgi:hypothetical protein
MRIIVTGSNGQVGREVVGELRTADDEARYCGCREEISRGLAEPPTVGDSSRYGASSAAMAASIKRRPFERKPGSSIDPNIRSVVV